jgi:phosphatidylserine/phosphatidylglycerophosphate/cardiolipin synthase-like enzyme
MCEVPPHESKFLSYEDFRAKFQERIGLLDAARSRIFLSTIFLRQFLSF